MLITDERTLAAIACIEPIHVDGMIGVIDLGETFLTCFYRLRAVKFDAGQMVYEREPVLSLVRPRHSLVPGTLMARILSRCAALQ